MKNSAILRAAVLLVAIAAIASCSRGRSDYSVEGNANAYLDRADVGNPIENNKSGSTIWDVFGGDNSDVTLRVNKYIWAASLEILDFLPIESVDPFSGIIVTGYGTPPGGGRSYRATIYIRDPALDARSLNVALQTRGGAVSEGTTRAVEDAILARARQLRVNDGKL